MSAAGKLVLVIDDDGNFLDLSARRLEKSGFRVLKASSWIDATPHLRQNPDVVLLDVHLISLDGDAICKILKKRFPDLKILLFSSEDETRLKMLAEEAQADGYVSKSASHQELVDRIMQVGGESE